MRIEDKISRCLGEGIKAAGAEGFIGGAAMVAGSIVAGKIAQKLADRKAKRAQIEPIQKQIEALRDQKSRANDAGKIAIEKRIEGLTARIQQMKLSAA